ncbi:helix-turn-helix transcriptional regulator [Streptomyces aculeolatus]
MRAVQIRPTRYRAALLSTYLDELRCTAGLTFADLAGRTGALGGPYSAVSSATLKRAATCRPVPKETTVVAFARGCGASDKEEHTVLELWRQARVEERGRLHQLQAPAVDNIRTPADLTAALAAVYELAGAPPLRILQQRAGTTPHPANSTGWREVFRLPLATVFRIVNRQCRCPTWEQCEAFLLGCGTSGERALGQWRQAWQLATMASRHARNVGPDGPSTLQRHQVLKAMVGTWVAPRNPRAALNVRLAPHWARALGRLNPDEIDIVLTAGLSHYLRGSARQNDAASDTRAAETQALLTTAGRPRPTPSKAIRRAVELIEEHAAEPITMADIAEAVGVSVRTLTAGFRHQMDSTPMRFLRETRLQYVQRELAAADPGTTTVTAVATRWGFTHLGRFSAHYRQRFGESPSITLRY